MIQLQPCAQAANGLPLDQPIQGFCLNIADAIEAFAGGAGLLNVMQGSEVIGVDDRFQRLGREQRQVVERHVGNQGPLQLAVQYRPVGAGGRTEVGVGGQGRRDLGSHIDVVDG
ncbi:hypothetical protein D3C81_1398290 [compost metagenome]